MSSPGPDGGAQGIDPSDPFYDDRVYGKVHLPGFDNYAAAANTNIPTQALLALEIIFYIMVSFVIIYLISHWVFHSWSFFNVFKLGFKRQREMPNSLSYQLMPLWTVLMFGFYTIYMGGFAYVTLTFLQYRKYFQGFFSIVSRGERTTLAAFMWVFYATSLFPVVINMFAAIVKLIKDHFYTRKAMREFKEVVAEREVEEHEKPGTLSRNPENAAVLTMPREKLPLVHIFVPVYNEPLPNLVGAINGITSSDYKNLQVYIGFDNYDIQETFFTLCRILTGVPLVNEEDEHDDWHDDEHDMHEFDHTADEFGGAWEGSDEHNSAVNGSDLGNSSHLGSNVDGPGRPSRQHSTEFGGSVRGRRKDKYNGFDQIVTDSPRLGRFPGKTGMPRRRRAPSIDFNADNCPDSYEVVYRGVRFTLFRFQHGGKLSTQKNMFENLQQSLQAEGVEEKPYVLFMDSDTAIMPDTVSQLVAELHRYPQSAACTGFVVSRNQDSYSFWRILQDAEYIESMMFRNAESIMGAVTCLPGVLTMFKYETLIEVAPEYFYRSEINSTFDFCRRYLGEDRYLTHILMEREGTYTLGFNSKAMCKTEAPNNFYNLLRQRRRWFLGTITNELIMLCTPLFWVKFPLLMLTKLFQILKVGGAITYLLVIEIIFGLIFDFRHFEWSFAAWLLLIIVPNWLFVTGWSVSEKRLKASLLFPVYYWFSPFFMVAVLMYSFVTVRERSWGGPRTVAVKVDGETVEADRAEIDDAVAAAMHEHDLEAVKAEGAEEDPDRVLPPHHRQHVLSSMDGGVAVPVQERLQMELRAAEYEAEARAAAAYYGQQPAPGEAALPPSH
ncbi:hypothetical protein RI367_003675 [Sorochytrium milnesiophthora]